jgi:hypothetical protein
VPWPNVSLQNGNAVSYAGSTFEFASWYFGTSIRFSSKRGTLFALNTSICRQTRLILTWLDDPAWLLWWQIAWFCALLSGLLIGYGQLS